MLDQFGHLIWKGGVFQFPTDDRQCDSVVWRKYAKSIDDVHALGCDAEKPPGKIYKGAITTQVGRLREVTLASGHAFEVNHEPDEGVHHAEVCVRPHGKLPKSVKADIRKWLVQVFDPREPHECDR